MGEPRIFGYDWAAIAGAQQRQSLSHAVDVARPGDYGCDPVGDGVHVRMVPSGDVVTADEARRRLATG